MKSQTQRRIIWRWWAQELLAVALIALGLSLGTGYSAPDNVHGAVYSWAQAHPGEEVPVLVQTTEDHESLAGFIASADGSVNRQFGIIPAVEASIPPSSIATVAARPDVSWISLDAPVLSTNDPVDITKTVSSYPFSVNADDPWSKGFTGTGVGVAVVDTGISPSGHEDFKNSDGYSRVIAEVEVNANTSNITDGYGHGTHIAGIIGGDGDLLEGKYVGVAPGVNLINVKIADEKGDASLSDVIDGLEFVYNNRTTLNIRVVNLSLTSSVAQSYQLDPLDAALEFLWFNGIFVVVAAGNGGDAPDAVHYAPANDPFVMTVGALDDMGTRAASDDSLASWSSRGVTQDGFEKPELATPGRGLVSVIDTNSILYKEHPEKVVDDKYFRLSGTSMSAAVMSGVAALVLERHPDWSPGELKCTLIDGSRSLSSSSSRAPRAGETSNESEPECNSDANLAPSTLVAPVLKVGAVAFVLGEPVPSVAAAQIGLDLNALLPNPTVTLNDVNWSAIKWGAIKWDAIKWGAIKWDAIKWSAIKWDSIVWDQVSPDGVDFAAIKWGAIKWGAIKWSAIKWSAIKWSAIKWSAIKWSAIKWNYVSED